MFNSMFKNEFKVTIRTLDVPIFAIIVPMVVAFILGAIYGKSNLAMITQVFASTITIGMAANGLMGIPLALSGYRSDKILKQWRVTPVPAWMILFVQFAIRLVLTIIATIGIWIILHFFFGYRFSGNILLFIGAYLLVTFAIFGIGMLIASLSPNENVTNLACSIAYFPMLLLSGSTIPLKVLPDFLVKIVQIFPLTQGINLLEGTLTNNFAMQTNISLLIMIILIVLSIIVSTKTFRWEV